MIDTVLAIVNDDAFENEWSLVMPTFPGCLDPVGINLRAVKVTSPDLQFEKYDVHYKTEKVQKPSGKQSTDKILTIDFRIDKYYSAYRSFQNWFNLIHNHENGTASADYVGGVSAIRIPITLMLLDANGIPTATAEVYKGCFIDKVPSRNYTYESGNPLVLSYTFSYLNMIMMK